MDDLTKDQESDLLAAELALGVLDPAERAAAETRASTDAGFAALVDAWRERLAPMLELADVAPPVDGWARIERMLPANDDAGPADGNGARFWRIATLVTGSIAAALAFVLVARPPALFPPSTPQQVAVLPALAATLVEDGGASVMTISYDDRTGRLLATPVGLRTDGLYPELWIIPEDGKARSLGVLDAGAPQWVTVAPKNRTHLHAGATFAVTLEPEGGAPGGVATGPVVVQGKIRAI